MKIYVEKIIISNRAPFDKLELNFNQNQISILSAINGSGNTTLLSHIVDSLYEMARPHFPSEFATKENQFYRVSSRVYDLNQIHPSFVYIRYRTTEGFIDYVDVGNQCTEEQYNEAIDIIDKIEFSRIKPILDLANNAKVISSGFNKKLAETIFSRNILTYFPAYRYEMPGYLNEPYRINLEFQKSVRFTGYLINPIEVVTGLPKLANWIMDVVLDMRLKESVPDNIVFRNLNNLITKTLISKKIESLRFGIGSRGFGGTRIQVMNARNNEQVYPTIFNLSSGESAILCLFGEILRQADNYKNNILLDEISGMVLIDEVDKHLHIKLQKEVLPKLFKLFPNVQFIVSSHSPFLSMGLAEELEERTRIIDLDNHCISTDVTSNELYTEVYNMMIGENERFKEMVQSLTQAIQLGRLPLIVTEGKTDVQHLKKAKDKLNIEDINVDFFEIIEDWGDSKLKTLLQHLSKIKHVRPIIGVFDRDDAALVAEVEKNGQSIREYGNNVFAFCIPIVDENEYGSSISIEHYYPKNLLLKLDSNGRRLFLGREFYESGNSIDGVYQTRSQKLPHKINVNGIVDEKVFLRDDLEQKQSVALTKANFANLITDDDEFSKNFSFESFKLIFDKIKEIQERVKVGN